jgi:hypothetical protein
VLGFFLGFLAIMAAADVGFVSALVATGHGTLAAVVLAASLIVAVGILVWIARTHRRDPTALMLGHVTARDYLAVQRWTAGDSTSGEFLELTQAVELRSGPLALDSAGGTDLETNVASGGASEEPEDESGVES